jgi:hypothetical protein
MTDQIIATFAFIAIVFGVMAALRIGLRASLVARLLIEALFAAPRQVARQGLDETSERSDVHGGPATAVPRAFELRLAA